MNKVKNSYNIVRDMRANEAQSHAVNRLLDDINALRSEVWVLRTTLFVAMVALILSTISNVFGG